LLLLLLLLLAVAATKPNKYKMLHVQFFELLMMGVEPACSM
jgi:hypothetical protein